eukprot:jgi/Botrbrau1/18287/Bobra.0179s0018.1
MMSVVRICGSRFTCLSTRKHMLLAYASVWGYDMGQYGTGMGPRHIWSMGPRHGCGSSHPRQVLAAKLGQRWVSPIPVEVPYGPGWSGASVSIMGRLGWDLN